MPDRRPSVVELGNRQRFGRRRSSQPAPATQGQPNVITQAPGARAPSSTSGSLRADYWKVMFETYWLMFQLASVSVWLVTALPWTVRPVK